MLPVIDTVTSVVEHAICFLAVVVATASIYCVCPLRDGQAKLAPVAD